MNVLILGFSSIVQRRVIPALTALSEVKSIDIACQRENVELAFVKQGSVFREYGDALAQSKADVVYVSLINSAHYQWVKEALSSDYHVIVDKPAFLSIEEAESMTLLANEKGKALIEANVFSYHPQIAEAKNTFQQYKFDINRVYACFSFPPMDQDNFRYSKEKGGGALYDLGPYALAAGKVFFDQQPENICASINSQSDEVDHSFSVLLSYSHGRSLVGHFGFDTSYQNRIHLISQGMTIELDRVFTTPPDMSNTLFINKEGDKYQRQISAFDSFIEFFKSVFADIRESNYQSHIAQLLQAAKAQQQLMRIAWEHA